MSLERIPIDANGTSFHFYPLGFAVFPMLALLAVNIREVDAWVALRPLSISMTATVVVLILLRAVLRAWHKAALLFLSFAERAMLPAVIALLWSAIALALGRERTANSRLGAT